MPDMDNSPGGTVRSSRWRLVLFVMVLAAAYVVPRALTLRDIHTAAIFDFADMADHLYFLDLVSKRHSLSPEQVKDEYFKAFPETQPRMLAIQWPPGLYHVARLWAPWFGTGSIWTTQVTNLLFSVVLLLGVVGLGRALGSWRIGLWAGLLTLLCPPLAASTLYFSLDYPLLAMIIVGLLLVWHTRGFTLWKYSLALGIWSAMGTVIKPTYALYVLGPALWALVAGLRGERSRLLVAARVLISAAVALALVVWIYAPDWQQIGVEARVHFLDRHLPGATTAPWTLEWFISNIKFAVINYPYPLLLLALPGVVLLHLPSRRPLPARWMFIVFLGSTYVILTALANKMERYIQPVYPVFCLLTVWWLVDRVPRRWQTPALSLVAAGFAAALGLTHLEKPIPWIPEPREAIARESAFHPFRYEFNMPDSERLAWLRDYGLDAECQFSPVVRQVSSWVRKHAPPRRPVGMVYIRRFSPDMVGHPPMPFRKMIPALTQALRDRFLLVGNLHVIQQLPTNLLHVPTLVILHGPEVDPAKEQPALKVIQQRVVQVDCHGQLFPFSMTLARPASSAPPTPSPPPSSAQ